MVQFYLRKIKAEEMTVEEVPTLWKKKVQAELDKENVGEE